jgi:hypothetical protein
MTDLGKFECGTKQIFPITIEEEGGAPVPCTGYRVSVLFVYDWTKSKEPKLSKDCETVDADLGQFQLALEPEDTINLSPRDYDVIIRVHNASNELIGSEKGKVTLW